MSVRAIVRDRSGEDRQRRAPKAAAGLEADLSLEFLRVVEQAALAAAQTVGRGDRHHSDQVAVEAMRRELGALRIDGRIVIGEGERDQAPMLYIGEKLGTRQGRGSERAPEVDIAVDPLEGTNLCADDEPNAIAVLAASERGGLLHAPDLYMEKLIVGSAARELVNLDAPVPDNLRAIARSLQLRVEDLVVIVLDRPRHAQLIQQIRATGARIRLISDGDLSAGIAVALAGSGVHAVMGIGGAPEGVLTAAALRCLGGEIFARLVVNNGEQEQRCRAMGIQDTRRVYRSRDLAPGRTISFAATGVTGGSLLDGVRCSSDGSRTRSLVMQTEPHSIRFIETHHVPQLMRSVL